MKGIFVTGTDTDVGKTLVCAWLARKWSADYWKPIQSGSTETTDAQHIASLAPGTIIHPSAYMLEAPLSPHEAARQQGITIDPTTIILPPTPRPLVVEGAGGIMVPLNDSAQMIDLMAQLGLPVLLVSANRLGTINHTLISLEILRSRHIPVLGVVLNGEGHPSNRDAIQHYGKVEILAELPRLAEVSAAAINLLPPLFEGVSPAFLPSKPIQTNRAKA